VLSVVRAVPTLAANALFLPGVVLMRCGRGVKQGLALRQCIALRQAWISQGCSCCVSAGRAGKRIDTWRNYGGKNAVKILQLPKELQSQGQMVVSGGPVARAS
jgi:hypothetical protein